MTITKEKKSQLLTKYIRDLSGATNAVIVQQKAIPVNVANKIRMDLKGADGEMNIIKKRIFLRALKDAGLEEVSIDALDGPVFALYSHTNEFGPLKVINKYVKDFKKEDKKPAFSFIGGWFEKKWQGAEYVNELANVPSKEESLAKLCYLFNYPLSSLACVINEVAKKNGAPVEEKKEEAKVVEAVKAEETPVEATEQSEGVPQGGEVKVDEAPAEEVKAEETPTAE